MAASMMNGCRRFLHNSLRLRWKDAPRKYKSSSTGAYCVFLPEVPMDTKETNTLMRSDELPCFSQLHAFNIISGCAKLTFEYDLLYEELLLKLTDGAEKNAINEVSFDEFFLPLEAVLLPLTHAESAVNAMHIGAPLEFKRELLDRIRGQINRARSQRFNNDSVYSHVLRLDGEKDLTESQRRLVSYYLNELRTNGVELSGNKRKKVRGRIDLIIRKEEEFVEKTMTHAQTFERRLQAEDWEIIKELPADLRAKMIQPDGDNERGPWRIGLGKQIFEPFIEYCPRRGLRASVWVDRHLVGTHKTGDVRTHTFQLIDEIRMHRNDIAKEIGYSCYAEMMNEYRMAESVDAVTDMFKQYRKHFLPMANVEIESMKTFISDRGLDVDLQQWDIPYFKRLQSDQLYKVNRMYRKPFFAVDKVLDTLFDLCDTLFQIKIKKAKEEIDTWHEDVEVYHVYNQDGKLAGTIFMDLYSRVDSKMWFSSDIFGRAYCKQLGITPISYLYMEFAKSGNLDQSPHSVSFKEVVKLFYEFGSVLRNILAENQYSELNSHLFMETDAADMLPYLMQQFALVPWVTKELSVHHLHQEPLTNKAVNGLIQCHNFMKGYDMCYEIYYSACDLEFHADNETYWKDIQTATYKKYMPIPINFEDWSFASDPTLWLGRSEAASYYKRIWSQMLAANVLESFKEAGIEDKQALASVGKRLKTTILQPAAGGDPLTVFRRFKGCNPSFDALTRLYPQYKNCEPVEELEED